MAAMAVLDPVFAFLGVGVRLGAQVTKICGCFQVGGPGGAVVRLAIFYEFTTLFTNTNRTHMRYSVFSRALVLVNSACARITPRILTRMVQVATALTALWVRLQVIFMTRQKRASLQRVAKAKADAAAAKQGVDAKQEMQEEQKVNDADDALEIEHSGGVHEKIRHHWHQRFVVLRHGTVKFYELDKLHWFEGYSYHWVSRAC